MLAQGLLRQLGIIVLGAQLAAELTRVFTLCVQFLNIELAAICHCCQTFWKAR